MLARKLSPRHDDSAKYAIKIDQPPFLEFINNKAVPKKNRKGRKSKRPNNRITPMLIVKVKSRTRN